MGYIHLQCTLLKKEIDYQIGSLVYKDKITNPLSHPTSSSIFPW